ncbi:MAG: DUF4139 domain-containing protein [Treponema sp.]|nr:DUF4139 domain-containing protein [Treponema sp.]
MKKTVKNTVICALALVLARPILQAQQDSAGRADAGNSAELPLRRITLFSSGVAYYEHSGAPGSPSVLRLSFKTEAVNDALKSLVINNPGTASSVTYPSEQTLISTLRSLSIDLSGNPSLAEILGSLKGTEVEISAPSSIRGRITGIEYRNSSPAENRLSPAPEPWLVLFTSSGLRSVGLGDIASVSFPDPRIGADLDRALDLIMASRNSGSRELTLNLGGGAVSVIYVIPSPVWKVSYRLDLSGAKAQGRSEAFLQGWAIVDNDSDSDWKNVELSLVAGRPVSFIQNLYPPLYLSRPVLPLAIAGTAGAETHDSGTRYGPSASAGARTDAEAPAPAPRNQAMKSMDMAAADEYVYAEERAVLSGGAGGRTQARAAGDQFEFTVKNPVSLDRRMSAMLPLAEARPLVRKMLILPGKDALGKNIHPRLGAEITNNTGMKLPAGPLTVYDGGTYAGDALIEFFSPGEKRLVSYGEDLSVTAAAEISSSKMVSAASVSGGIMTISRRQIYDRKYTIKNNSAETRDILIEHPQTAGAELSAQGTGAEALNNPEEKTPDAYRFLRSLDPGSEKIFTVREEVPVSERITLGGLRIESFLSYASNQEIPANVRRMLQEAAALKQKADAAKEDEAGITNRRDRLVSEQARIRANLQAAGSGTPQGQEYLKRLSAADSDIDGLTRRLEEAEKASRTAQEAFESYITSITL